MLCATLIPAGCSIRAIALIVLDRMSFRDNWRPLTATSRATEMPASHPRFDRLCTRPLAERNRYTWRDIAHFLSLCSIPKFIPLSHYPILQKHGMRSIRTFVLHTYMPAKTLPLSESA